MSRYPCPSTKWQRWKDLHTSSSQLSWIEHVQKLVLPLSSFAQGKTCNRVQLPPCPLKPSCLPVSCRVLKYNLPSWPTANIRSTKKRGFAFKKYAWHKGCANIRHYKPPPQITNHQYCWILATRQMAKVKRPAYFLHPKLRVWLNMSKLVCASVQLWPDQSQGAPVLPEHWQLAAAEAIHLPAIQSIKHLPNCTLAKTKMRTCLVVALVCFGKHLFDGYLRSNSCLGHLRINTYRTALWPNQNANMYCGCIGVLR